MLDDEKSLFSLLSNIQLTSSVNAEKIWERRGWVGSRTKKSSRHPPTLLFLIFGGEGRGGRIGSWGGTPPFWREFWKRVGLRHYTSWQSRSLSLLIFFPFTFLDFRAKSDIEKMFFSKKYVIYGSKYLAREIWEICCFVRPAKPPEWRESHALQGAQSC